MSDAALSSISERIAEIESDDRWQADSANVQINAPLALIQQDMAGELRGLYRAKNALECDNE